MRNGEVVYYCKRISDKGAELELFAKPIPITLRLHHLTIQPASGYSSVIEFGENISKTWTGMGQPYREWIHLQEGDRFYIDGAIPNGIDTDTEPEDGWGSDANARISSVRLQNYAVRFILQKIE